MDTFGLNGTIAYLTEYDHNKIKTMFVNIIDAKIEKYFLLLEAFLTGIIRNKMEIKKYACLQRASVDDNKIRTNTSLMPIFNLSSKAYLKNTDINKKATPFVIASGDKVAAWNNIMGDKPNKNMTFLPIGISFIEKYVKIAQPIKLKILPK